MTEKEPCHEVLKRKISKDDCMDSKKKRQRALCLAHQKVQSGEERGFGPALSKAWKEIKESCGVTK